MVWQFFALGSAACESFFQIGIKKWLKDRRSQAKIILLTGALALVAYALTGFGEIKQDFWVYGIIDSVFFTIALFFYYKAFELEDASLVSPMLALIPLFSLFTSPLITGDSTSNNGIVGVVLIATGAFFLQRVSGKKLSLNNGMTLMILSAFVFSVSMNFAKLAVIRSSPLFTAGFTSIFAGIIFLIIFNKEKTSQKTQTTLQKIIVLSLFSLGTETLALYALSTGPVTYAAGLILLSPLLTVILAGTLLEEKQLFKRLGSAVLMVAGAIILSVA